MLAGRKIEKKHKNGNSTHWKRKRENEKINKYAEPCGLGVAARSLENPKPFLDVSFSIFRCC
jgi:hypothetical protein